MANLPVIDGASAAKYLKSSGAGSDGDPHIPQHLETNSAAILAAVDGVEALLGTIDADTSALFGTVAGTEMQVDVVAALPAGTNLLGKVGIDQSTANANEVVVKSGTVTSVTTITNAVAVTNGALSVVGSGTEATAQRVTIATDSTGVMATKDAGAAWVSSLGVAGVAFTSADAQTAAAVTDAPTGGQKLVITDVVISVGSTAMQVDLELETSGAVFYTFYLAANSTIQFTPRGKWKLPTADKKLMVDTSAAGAITVTALYFSEA